MEALQRVETRQDILAGSIKPSDINLENCFFLRCFTTRETITVSGLLRVYQARGAWGETTEAEVSARFSGIIRQFSFPSLVAKGHLLQSGEKYFSTKKFIETCHKATPRKSAAKCQAA
jgi:hypothetical protein